MDAIYGKTEHMFGPPYPHMFIACLEELAVRKTLGKKARRVLSVYCRWANSDKITVEHMCQHVKLFSISKAQRQGGVRLRVALSDNQPPAITQGSHTVPITKFNRVLSTSLRCVGGIIECGTQNSIGLMH